MTKVLVVDDDPMVRTGLSFILRGVPGLTVAWQAGDGAEALESLGREPVDVVLLDIRMPVLDGLATLTALHADPGLPDTGVIALLDFGASGTGLTLVDAATGFTPIGETQRLPFSGDEVDAAVLRAVLTDLERHGDVDPAATAAVGSLVRLRHECRVAKERLSAEPAVSLVAALPGHHSEVRFTRAELDALVEQMTDGTSALAFNELDTAFHLTMARMGHNRLVRDLTVAIRETVTSLLLAAEHVAPEWDRLRDELTAEHRAIVAAIRAGDVERAGRLSAEHIQHSHAALGLAD